MMLSTSGLPQARRRPRTPLTSQRPVGSSPYTSERASASSPALGPPLSRVTSAPYLTNEVSHHGQATLNPPLNHGRRRQAVSSESVPLASSSYLQLPPSGSVNSAPTPKQLKKRKKNKGSLTDADPAILEAVRSAGVVGASTVASVGTLEEQSQGRPRSGSRVGSATGVSGPLTHIQAVDNLSIRSSSDGRSSRSRTRIDAAPSFQTASSDTRIRSSHVTSPIPTASLDAGPLLSTLETSQTVFDGIDYSEVFEDIRNPPPSFVVASSGPPKNGQRAPTPDLSDFTLVWSPPPSYKSDTDADSNGEIDLQLTSTALEDGWIEGVALDERIRRWRAIYIASSPMLNAEARTGVNPPQPQPRLTPPKENSPRTHSPIERLASERDNGQLEPPHIPSVPSTQRPRDDNLRSQSTLPKPCVSEFTNDTSPSTHTAKSSDAGSISQPFVFESVTIPWLDRRPVTATLLEIPSETPSASIMFDSPPVDDEHTAPASSNPSQVVSPPADSQGSKLFQKVSPTEQASSEVNSQNAIKDDTTAWVSIRLVPAQSQEGEIASLPDMLPARDPSISLGKRKVTRDIQVSEEKLDVRESRTPTTVSASRTPRENNLNTPFTVASESQAPRTSAVPSEVPIYAAPNPRPPKAFGLRREKYLADQSTSDESRSNAKYPHLYAPTKYLPGYSRTSCQERDTPAPSTSAWHFRPQPEIADYPALAMPMEEPERQPQSPGPAPTIAPEMARLEPLDMLTQPTVLRSAAPLRSGSVASMVNRFEQPPTSPMVVPTGYQARRPPPPPAQRVHSDTKPDDLTPSAIDPPVASASKMYAAARRALRSTPVNFETLPGSPAEVNSMLRRGSSVRRRPPPPPPPTSAYQSSFNRSPWNNVAAEDPLQEAKERVAFVRRSLPATPSSLGVSVYTARTSSSQIPTLVEEPTMSVIGETPRQLEVAVTESTTPDTTLQVSSMNPFSDQHLTSGLPHRSDRTSSFSSSGSRDRPETLPPPPEPHVSSRLMINSPDIETNQSRDAVSPEPLLDEDIPLVSTATNLQRASTFTYTDLDVLLHRLETATNGEDYEDNHLISEILGNAKKSTDVARQGVIDDLPVGRVEIVSRRVDKVGKVKQKLEVVGIRCNKCSVCLTQFKAEQLAVVLPCLHVYHTHCITSWFRRQHMCPLCREPIDKDVWN